MSKFAKLYVEYLDKNNNEVRNKFIKGTFGITDFFMAIQYFYELNEEVKEKEDE